MTGFDSELYLRLLGEQTVLAVLEDDTYGSSPLGEAAAALVAVGLISAHRAQAVLADYALAQAVRSEHGRHPGLLTPRAPRRNSAKALDLGRVIALGDELELPEGVLRLRYALLKRRGRGHARRRRASSLARRRRSRPRLVGTRRPR
jgi:hypothetical protein